MKKVLLSFLLLFSTWSVYAGEPPASKYYMIDRTAKMVLEDAPCTVFKDATIQLWKAYAINTETGDRVDGCFALYNSDVYIRLVGDENGAPVFYDYKFPQSLFEDSPTL